MKYSRIWKHPEKKLIKLPKPKNQKGVKIEFDIFNKKYLSFKVFGFLHQYILSTCIIFVFI
jgi:hypothetical protein